jgi:rsbT co-antagonist protein RsbR
MTRHSEPPSEAEAAVAGRLSTIVLLLNEVTGGTYSSRLPELPESDAFALLFRAINEMVDTLAAARETAEKFQTELTERLATIEQQRAAIRELSTPVIEVWDRVLCLPVVGVMDTTRGAEMTESLLRGVVEKRARCTILDVTGIEVMDTATADHFLRMAKAVRLLGAECMITGISPSIAQTIVHMGVNLGEVRTHRSLRDALFRYVIESMTKARLAKR